MQMVGELVVPCWPSAFFWPCIVNEHRSFRSYIVDFMLLKGSVFLCMVQIKIVVLVRISLVPLFSSSCCNFCFIPVRTKEFATGLCAFVLLFCGWASTFSVNSSLRGDLLVLCFATGR